MSARKKGFVVAIGLILALCLALVGCGGGASSSSSSTSGSGASATGSSDSSTKVNLVKDGVLTIGSDCDYPPFIYMDGEEAKGFERELLEAIAGKMGLTLEYLPPQNFDTILVSVSSNSKMDLGVSSFTITDERKDVVDFCTPYFDSNQAVVSLRSKAYPNAAALEGKTVGAQSGTTGESWALENIPGITMKTYTQTSEALAALAAGDIEAVIYDEPVAAEHMQQGTWTDAEIIQRIATGEQYGMAVSKDNTALKEAVSKALADLKADGTFDTIFKKYFPDLDPPALKAS